MNEHKWWANKTNVNNHIIVNKNMINEQQKMNGQTPYEQKKTTIYEKIDESTTR